MITPKYLITKKNEAWSIQDVAFYVAIVVMSMFFLVKPLFAQTASPKNPTWYKYTSSDTVFIFVHGIFSNSQEAWTAHNGSYWPALLGQDKKRFDQPSIFLGGYFTDFSSGIYRVNNAAADLLSYMRTLIVAVIHHPLLNQISSLLHIVRGG